MRPWPAAKTVVFGIGQVGTAATRTAHAAGPKGGTFRAGGRRRAKSAGFAGPRPYARRLAGPLAQLLRCVEMCLAGINTVWMNPPFFSRCSWAKKETATAGKAKTALGIRCSTEQSQEKADGRWMMNELQDTSHANRKAKNDLDMRTNRKVHLLSPMFPSLGLSVSLPPSFNK